MSKYRNNLPNVNTTDVFLSDGGFITYMYYERRMDKPEFIPFKLVSTKEGKEMFQYYVEEYLSMAVEKFKVGFILSTPQTWKATPDFAREKMNMSYDEWLKTTLECCNENDRIRKYYEDNVDDCPPIVISGLVGPKGDGYRVDEQMTPDESEKYHFEQIRVFAEETTVDMIMAYTLTYIDEAIGIAEAAKKANIPVGLSFTVERNGKLTSKETLEEAIKIIDEKTDSYPAFYMLNCSHPSHFPPIYDDDSDWSQRIRCVRPNASKKSHKELDEIDFLDEGDPSELGKLVADLYHKSNGRINMLGGCCGTDMRHVRQIALNVIP